jgi:hypothetical protein
MTAFSAQVFHLYAIEALIEDDVNRRPGVRPSANTAMHGDWVQQMTT